MCCTSLQSVSEHDLIAEQWAGNDLTPQITLKKLLIMNQLPLLVFSVAVAGIGCVPVEWLSVVWEEVIWLLFTGHVCRQNGGQWRGCLRHTALSFLLFFFLPPAQRLSGYVSLAVHEYSGKCPYLGLKMFAANVGVGTTSKMPKIFHSESTCRAAVMMCRLHFQKVS